ncbi:MAG: helix-turn-helix domain-containing protein, partial [Rubrivivax sp.]|nr:helix-turn-helix domain-containing protein [Rubrivivax sp.]
MSEPATADNPSAGALLRAAREKQGLHIAALAAAIKVSPRKLDALENDRWHELPDATFTRALAQPVCRTLKIDARPVLDKLPSAGALPFEAGDQGINEPFRERPGREAPGPSTAAVRPMVWGAALLMAAAVLVYVLPADLWVRLSALVASAG